MTSAPKLGQELAVALDFTSRDLLFSWINQFEGLPVVLKLGLGILPELSFDDYAALKKSGFKIFIDAKLHDIPTQVQRSVQKWVQAGADYLTVHCMGGVAMMRAAAEIEAQSATRILAVSVLTSHSDAELKDLGFNENAEKLVLRYIKLGLEAGLSSFVCSAFEIDAIRALQKDVFLTTPGLVLDSNEKNADQARVMTVHDAIQKGSNLLVVGRSLMKAKEPRIEVEKILQSFVLR